MTKLESKWVKMQSQITFQKFFKKYKETMLPHNQSVKGRERCTIASDDRIIKRLCIGDRRKSSGYTHGKMAKVSVMLSERAFGRRLQGFELNARSP